MKINAVAILIAIKSIITIMEKNADVPIITDTNPITNINRGALALMTAIPALADVNTAAV